ncbi:FAD-dependent monooxygenase [Pseudaestuariivita atlantica]|uniref:2-octaprenyl-6-methoxyphenyl hydroxylase n=1 Tax=Pseudaestuariivita atlantica TaxID=1317121 RepID=A0A0L1JVB9_9RHOB|nr:FAD-dependent monooxygenase [Pseudaestuariivita atlantica]KNG95695.1 2-octaprenyl-6-methoxyphenyl hydroxylase [Pseudaestuariivita atlantica]
MSDTTCDILISGGGIAGLTAALLFGQAGFDVICVDPVPPVTDDTQDGADMRSTAFLQPARDTLEAAGLWVRLGENATPLQVMRLMDVATDPPVTRDFDAADVSDAPFGWNVPNWLMRRELVAAVAETPGVTFRPGTGVARFTPRSGEALIDLTDGDRIRARLVIGADGRNSPTRKAAGIGAHTTRFGQRALAFAVTHPIPHGNVSTEIHDTGGPFTLVPLPDRDGVPASAVVWMDRGPAAQEVYNLDEPAFNAAMSERSHHVLGPLTLATRRSIWPMIAQLADRLDGPRLALVAEAAHVVPPIGAQGLNMSLADLVALRDAAVAAPDTLGEPEMLRRYHRARYADISARVTGITALNRASMAASPLARSARARAMSALYDVAPVRSGLMQLGLGTRKLG